MLYGATSPISIAGFIIYTEISLIREVNCGHTSEQVRDDRIEDVWYKKIEWHIDKLHYSHMAYN